MTTSSSGILFGVFHHDSDAKKVIEALIKAGFDRDQIGLASTKSGSKMTNYVQDLVRLGVPQARAEYYNSEFRAGHPVVSVNANGREQETSALLGQYGAYDEQNRDVMQTAGTDDVFDDEEVHRLKIREERLRVGKQAVQTGEASLHKEVVVEQQTIDVPVTHEEVFIERRPGSGQVSNIPVGQNETVNVPVRREQVNVSKSTVETGEVAIGKQTVQEQKHISDTVRREEVRLDKEGNPIIHEVTVDPNNP
jgi:uncharacterized protein (TIGR02271 family)